MNFKGKDADHSQPNENILFCCVVLFAVCYLDKLPPYPREVLFLQQEKKNTNFLLMSTAERCSTLYSFIAFHFFFVLFCFVLFCFVLFCFVLFCFVGKGDAFENHVFFFLDNLLD